MSRPRAEAVRDAAASAREIVQLRERQLELTRQLESSLALEEWSGRPIFEHGRVRSYVSGNAFSPERATFKLELGNGESLEWPLTAVPVRFWPSFAAELESSRSHIGRAFVAAARKKESGQ